MYICIYVYMYVCIYVYMYVYVYVCRCVDVCVSGRRAGAADLRRSGRRRRRGAPGPPQKRGGGEGRGRSKRDGRCKQRLANGVGSGFQHAHKSICSMY